MVWLGCRADSVDRDLDIAVSGVFEANGTGEAGSEFPVSLALGCPGSNRTPGDKVGDVLGTDQVQVLCTTGDSHVTQVEQ